MKIFRNTVTAIILMLFIISFAVTATLNFRPLFYFDIHHLNLESESGYSQDIIRENYDALIDYNSIFNHDELLTFPSLPMSDHAQIHFKEVKQIFVAIQYLLVFTALISAILIFLLCFKYKDFLFLKLTSIFTIVIPAVLAIIIGLNWEKAFVTFHHIFFKNNYWLFYPDKDPIILMLPDEYFFHCAAMIIILAILGSVISYVIYRHLQKKTIKIS